MKKLLTLWYKLTDKNFTSKLQSAKNIKKMLVESTNGKVSHFYDSNGKKIRGYAGRQYKFSNVVEHPLINKYR